jgi:hypothetical protein
MSAGAVRCPRGFVLPMALFFLPALTAISLAAFVLVRAQWMGVRLDVLLAEEFAAASPPPSLLPASGEVPIALGGGFVLFRAPPGPLGGPRRGLRLAWTPDLEAVAAGWSGIHDGGARLGPIPLSRLLWAFEQHGLAFGAEAGGEGVDLPSGPQVEAPGGWILPVEGGRVAILSPGDVRIAGEGVVAGVVMVGGDLHLDPSVRVQGGVGVEGRIRSVATGAAVVPDPDVVFVVLSHPLFHRPHLVPGAERLGRP